MSLKDIKLKIKSVDRTRKVTKAMEAVSAVKMRKSQVRALTGRPYARAALSVLSRIAPSLATVRHALTAERPVKKAALIVVTSDKGLCGVLNAAVLKEANRAVQALGIPKESVSIYAFGKKGAEFFDRRGYDMKARFDNVSDDVRIEDIENTVRAITAAYGFGYFDRVVVAYTAFKSTFEQESRSNAVLPLSFDALADIVARITPQRGAFAEADAQKAQAPASYTVEPAPETVLETLIPRLASVIVYHALLESKASEHSARMIAMKNASDKSRDLSKALTRRFNKARQAAITREVSEIVGGIEAMAGA